MSSDDPNKSIAKRQIARLIGSSDIPMYVLDEQDILVYANEAMLAWIASIRGPDSVPLDLIGLNCRFHSRPLEGQPDTEPDGATDRLADWIAQLAPPTLWDRSSLHVSSWDDATAKVIVPLEPHSDGMGVPGPTGTLLVLRLPERLLDIYRRLQSGSRECPLPKSTDGESSLPWPWLIAGQSLRAVLLRQQWEMACASETSTILIGDVCEERDALIAMLARTRASRKNLLYQPGSTIRVDCHLMDGSLLESVLEAVDEVIRSFGSRASLFLSRLDELPEELLLALDRYLASRPELVTFASCRKPLHESRGTNSLWLRLWLRLSPLRIELPSLRERLEDLDSIIASWFQARQQLAEQGLRIRSEKISRHLTIASPAKDALLAYPWPGSYEELASVLESSIQQSEGGEIGVSHLPIAIRTSPSHFERPPSLEPIALDEVLEQVEKQLIMEALEHCKGNRTAASKLLSISRARMIRRLQQWGLIQDSTSGDEEAEGDLPQFEEIRDD
ncbi:Transcriptional regulatory protein ZraR [Pirellula sp. SH-Sr6A]|uniref:helix-turn-helix domain-containing protein n=1 Tax=Pirellula sp. SH-Sr6A TaxID=1632865 RepID=UPI00078C1D8A|nr:helix-turn-helix domain-containing protein [Pirellula sp. SH-Sr6A]AMV34616.1 Transcriptional regulatory protein ZraR [Pirellula sp. SH-Sr6A]